MANVREWRTNFTDIQLTDAPPSVLMLSLSVLFRYYRQLYFSFTASQSVFRSWLGLWTAKRRPTFNVSFHSLLWNKLLSRNESFFLFNLGLLFDYWTSDLFGVFHMQYLGNHHSLIFNTNRLQCWTKNFAILILWFIFSTCSKKYNAFCNVRISKYAFVCEFFLCFFGDTLVIRLVHWEP